MEEYPEEGEQKVKCLGNLSKYLKRKSKGQKDDSSSSWYLPSTSGNLQDQKLPQYATWPAEHLRSCIRDLIKIKGEITDPETISSIETEVETKLNDICPFEIQEQFDFCVVCPQVDYNSAMTIKNRVSAEFDLVGHVLWESVNLGTDLLDAFENVLKRSTKVVFYVSENFDEYDFCCHLARNHLMQQSSSGSERNVVPLLKNDKTEVPEGLKLLDRLVLTNELQFQFRFPAIFTDEVREKKVTRKLNFEKEADDKRKLFVSRLVQEKLQVVDNTVFEYKIKH